jgi:hypothetical protein
MLEWIAVWFVLSLISGPFLGRFIAVGDTWED